MSVLSKGTGRQEIHYEPRSLMQDKGSSDHESPPEHSQLQHSGRARIFLCSAQTHLVVQTT